MEQESLFWADQKAEEIVDRKKFHYIDKEISKPDKYVIKTSASISGVLHIGRLSDTIRSESVCRALKDQGYPVELIWIAEDVDPLRKIPEGVPDEYAEYIGMPVINTPDPWGCHSSYAEHHISRYNEVLDEFVAIKIKRYSMREEYKKGNFKHYIKAMLDRLDKVIEIQNKYRDQPLKQGWSPWTPLCDNCGKIITPKIKEFKEGKAVYKCNDYHFETMVAKGCGYEGENDPLKGNGKLMWKGEWAAQWARWKVASEGAGKEYVVPSSAWWVNGEIAERILRFPMPVPIFYEHLIINGEKMSASLGNVVYPHDWLEVAPAELLRFFYNKKLMKTRSFSWRDLPNLYDEYDRYARVHFGEEMVENEREAKHMKRLYEISQLDGISKPISLPFSHAAMISQIFIDDSAIIESLERSKHYEKEKHDLIMRRIKLARNWANKYAPVESRVTLLKDCTEVKKRLSSKQKTVLFELAKWLEEERTPNEIHNQIYNIANKTKLPLNEAFQAIYLSLLGATQGPKAGAFIASLDRQWAIQRFKEVVA